MCFIDHLLIEVRLEQLYLTATIFYGTLHDTPRVITGTTASGNIRCHFLQSRQHTVVTAHKIRMLLAIVLTHQIYDLLQKCPIHWCIIAIGLNMDVHHRLTCKLL